IFTRVRDEYPSAVTCYAGCSDCCHALFDLPLIEAVYLNRAFNAAFPHGPARSAILERADAADRAVHKIKRKAFKAEQAGENTNDILEQLSREKIRCPLLVEEEGNPESRRCALYAQRPLTCRLYGIPTAIGGKGHTCALSAFDPGKQYPTVKMEALYGRLATLSVELARCAGSGYSQIHTVLVPVSMALLTDYNAAYFGIGIQTAHSERIKNNG
ncbi:YkgJ family cysteine cluster protein, partial [Desulfovibrio sp. OttesenSCG-928-I05]|nr:YkgJ family cysteine cluster protein [Desulfovibrio sp. OttesenSCG-928-I05]